MTKLRELSAGDVVELDAGFDCAPAGRRHLYNDARSNRLYFNCSCGAHYVDGQEDEPGADLVGVRRIEDLPQTSSASHYS